MQQQNQGNSVRFRDRSILPFASDLLKCSATGNRALMNTMPDALYALICCWNPEFLRLHFTGPLGSRQRIKTQVVDAIVDARSLVFEFDALPPGGHRMADLPSFLRRRLNDISRIGIRYIPTLCWHMGLRFLLSDNLYALRQRAAEEYHQRGFVEYFEAPGAHLQGAAGDAPLLAPQQGPPLDQQQGEHEGIAPGPAGDQH
ncbi:uncharacterized protein LOC132203951 [Neocloeon triangulifer]|uniref:uncharacterized protein LOC132203951 n=1 Tax=Neocloeon triangulifer TaxID=2078957 RepID=UPI00286F3607|nr:uncharacterized protein LOC132203951 [Neocloeon triangulifer]